MKYLKLIILVLLSGQVVGQVAEGFDNTTGTSACWRSFRLTGGCGGGGDNRGVAPTATPVFANPIYSINNTNPITGTGSLHIADTVTTPEEGECYIIDSLYSTAVGQDGDNVSLDFRINHLGDPSSLYIVVVCGDFAEYHYYNSTDVDSINTILNINTTIDNSNGGGVVTIAILLFGSNAGVSLDLDNFTTTAAPDTENACYVALPVSFGNIHATLNNGLLTLNWSTVTETNNDHFEIETSVDGKSFTKVGTIESKAVNGNSNEVIAYSFIKNTSAAVGTIALLLLLVPAVRRRKQLMALMAIAAITIIGISCNKNSEKFVDTTGGSMYVRIVQVATDGSKSYSKVVTVAKYE